MPDWSRCWMCQEPLNPGDAVLQAKPRSVGDVAGRIVLGFTALVVVLLVVGAARELGPQAAAMTLLTFTPAFFITLTKALVRRRSANPMTAFSLASTFAFWSVLSVIVSTIGAVVVLIITVISIIEALFTVCAKLLSQGAH